MGEVKKIDTPKVSVIVPVYNTAFYLDATIGSIVRQTERAIEIIIIDDGSTDDGWEIIQRWAIRDTRIRIYRQENKGLSETRNRGVKLAVGDYIYFMDSDDLIEADTLACCYTYCAENELDFLTFDTLPFYEPGQPGLRRFTYNRQALTPEKLYTGAEALESQLRAYEFQSSVCLHFISGRFLRQQQLLFYPGILHEDQLFTFMLYLKAARIAYIQRSFFHRRVRTGSIMTTTFSQRNMHAYFTIARELKRKTTADGKEKEIVHLFLSQMLDAAVWQAHELPLGQRLKVFFHCLLHWRDFVSSRTLIVLLIKKYRRKKEE